MGNENRENRYFSALAKYKDVPEVIRTPDLPLRSTENLYIIHNEIVHLYPAKAIVFVDM